MKFVRDFVVITGIVRDFKTLCGDLMKLEFEKVSYKINWHKPYFTPYRIILFCVPPLRVLAIV